MERRYKARQMTANQRGISFVLLLALLFTLPMFSFADLSGRSSTSIDLLNTAGSVVVSPKCDVFKTLKVTAGSAEGGLVDFDFAMKMDDNYSDDGISNDGSLYDVYFKYVADYLDEAKEPDDFIGEQSKYWDFLESVDDAKLPPITFFCTFSGVQLEGGAANKSEDFNVNIAGLGEKHFGTYEMDQVDSDTVSFQCKLDKWIYDYQTSGVIAGFSLSFEATESSIGDGQVSLDFNGDKGSINAEWPEYVPPGPSETVEYVIEKSAPEETDTPYIDYVITAAAFVSSGGVVTNTAATLAGLHIVDYIP